jgi:uncharacterized protein (DUF305 family)|tara:strand:+ start:16244 stop:16849 length:606 start_codon:yes stop_codon:yes gene_type:complete
MMKNKIRAAALVAVPLAAALFLAGCADNGGSMPGMDHGGSDSSPSDSAADFNAADEMFATMMIPHHEQAVEMSDMILAKSDVDPRVLELAQQIKDAQQPEIDTMEGWLEDWGVDGMDMGGMDHGGDGMMSEEDMAALEAATGPEAARLFLEQMILHHQGAIEMAEAELQDGKNADALALAQAVVDTQSAEITTMQDLLTQL